VVVRQDIVESDIPGVSLSSERVGEPPDFKMALDDENTLVIHLRKCACGAERSHSRPVDGVRKDFLSRTAFTYKQDRTFRYGEFSRHLLCLSEVCAGSQEVVKRVPGL